MMHVLLSNNTNSYMAKDIDDRNIEEDLLTLERILGFVFENKANLLSAITHRSYLNEHREAKQEHNERLEFLGDAVLELVVTDFLFHKYKETQPSTAIEA